ncbi:MAG: SDR family oxidoreductase [Halioglobus sp.]
MTRLREKVAIITGSTSGMGETTAEIFVREGARVVISGRNEIRGKEIAAALGEDNALFVRADVTNEKEIANLVDVTMQRFGKIDCLFNNAAGPTQEVPITELDAEQLPADMMNVFGSVLLVTKQVVPHMKTAGRGSIINNGSSAAHRANSSPLIYSGLKAGVCHLSRCMAMEFSEFGIRVNTISPGAIVTPIFAKGLGVPAEMQAQATELLSQALGQAVPVGRSGKGEDIANAAVYLASDDSGYVTGQDFVIDGGLTSGLSPLQKRAQWQKLQEALAPLSS